MLDHKPYLDKESATMWLSRHLQNNGMDIRTMWHLNLMYNLIDNGEEIFRRIPQEVFYGLPEGSRRNVAASVIARAVSCTDPEERQGVGASGYTKTQELIGSWAEKDGCWHDYADSDLLKQGMIFGTSGSEAHVYYNGNHVYKINDYNHYGTIERLLDRISIHNAVFPEASLTVVGFGMKDDSEDNRGFSIIIKQPTIIGSRAKDPEEVYNSLIDRDLKPLNATSWCFTSQTKNILLQDIHDQNMIRTREGRIIIFDCEAELNTDPRTQGSYVIPEVEYSEEAIAAIDGILDRICPRTMTVEELEKVSPDAARTIRAGRRYEGLIEMNTDNGTIKAIAAPDGEGKVLVTDIESVALMVPESELKAEDREKLLQGHTIVRNGRCHFFNQKKGRMDCRQSTAVKQTKTLKNQIR